MSPKRHHKLTHSHRKYFVDKIPEGRVWASPGRPEGYLRTSVLCTFGAMVGDDLPDDFYGQGLTFEDSSTFPTNANVDVAAGLELARLAVRSFRAKEDEEDVEDDEDDEEEEEGDEEEET